MDLLKQLQAHPGTKVVADPNDYEVIHLADPQGASRLAAMGVRLTGEPYGCYAYIHRDAGPMWLNVTLGYMDCALVLGPSNRLSGNIDFRAGHCVFATGGRPNNDIQVAIDARLTSSRNAVLWGEGSTSNGSQIVTCGHNAQVIVGRDCMFAMDIWVRTSDMHAVVDLETGTVINQSESIKIGNHVWIGQDSLLLPGCSIGDGSLIGAKSLVKSAIPPMCVAAGQPARVLRENVSWTRESHPSPETIETLRKSFTAPAHS